MTDRVAVDIKKHTLIAGTWKDVYTPPGAPIDVPVSVMNLGGDIIEVYTSASNASLPLAAGGFAVMNSSQPIKAKSLTAPALLLVAFGVNLGSAGATESGGASAADVELIAVANTSKQLLARVLLELKINNAYNSNAHNEELTTLDLRAGDSRLVDVI